MAKINKIRNNGSTIYPVTIPQAVVDPYTQESLSTKLDAIDLEFVEVSERIDTVEENIENYKYYIYGIEIDNSVSTSVKTRIGNMYLHSTLPIQSKIRRCLLLDNGIVNYYLADENSNLKEDGTPANLDGTDGMVMVEIPKHYRKFETEGTFYRAYVSEMPIPGFHEVPKMYISAFEAAIDRTNTAQPKLASVINTSAAFRGGNNTAAWDGTYRTLLGRPGTQTSLTNFRAYARRRGSAGMNGAGWNAYLDEAHQALYWLYTIEYANTNCQLDFNPTLTANGYKQGGLGIGVTNMSDWNGFNGTNPFIPCGTTNSLGNKTGVVSYTTKNEDGTTRDTLSVPSYRGVENPFGHIWKWTDGVKCRIQSDEAGGLSEVYTCNNPANFQDVNYGNYVKMGDISRTEGYVKKIIGGEHGVIMPSEVGGSSNTYFCDYFYTNIPATSEAQRGVLLGGGASRSALAGLSYANALDSASLALASIGSRLCFLPNNTDLELATVAFTGLYNDLTGKPNIPDITPLATKAKLQSDVNTLETKINTKQNTLVSGTNIKTINGVSVLGSGDIVIGEDGGITANPLTLLINGTTQTTFNGSAVSNFNVTPANLGVYTKGEIDASTTTILDEIETKQDVLVSGTNIKTVNSLSLVGSGNVTIPTFSGNYNDLTNKPAISVEPAANSLVQRNAYGLIDIEENAIFYNKNGVRSWLEGVDNNGNFAVNSLDGAGSVEINGAKVITNIETSVASTANYIVRRDSDSSIHVSRVRLNASAESLPIIQVGAWFDAAGGTVDTSVLRKVPLAYFKTQLGSFPASDVSAWAKAATKPSYSYAEITGTAPSTTTPNSLTFTGSSTGVFNGSNALTINIPAATTTLPWASITGKPNFSKVATSNSYDDLDNKPFIPDTSLLVSKDELEEDLLTKVNVSQKINGKSYGTADITLTPNDINTYSKSEIENLIMQVNTAQFRGPYATIQEFPTPYDTNDLYLLGTTAPYRIYAYIDSGLKEIGSSATDLSNYYSKTETDTKLSTKQNTLVSGTSIKTINGTTVLGAGNIAVSTFSGSYTDLTNKPTSLPASDVSAWAKQPNKPEYTYSEVGAAPLVHNHNSLYEPIFSKNTAFNKNFGTTSGTVTQGNDSRLSDARTPLAHTHTVSQITDFPSSMPASDVSAWAKAATKPTYTWTEITSKPTTFTPSAHTHNMNEVLDATIINVPVGTITRKTIVANGKTSQGFNSRVALGLSNLSDRFAPAILSVGLNEDGTEWLNYIFDTDGRIYVNGNVVAFITDAPAAHTQSIDTISDINATWKTTLKSAPSAFVTRWPTYAEVTGKPSTFTPSAHTHTLSDITDVANVTVSWANVTSKPTTFAPSAHTHAWSEITSKPTFATVATSGSYNDLTDKPTIPSAYTLPTASSSVKGGIRVGDGMVMDGERMGIASYFLNHLAFIVGYSELYEYPNAGELQIDKHLLVFNGVTPAISPLHLNNSIDVGKEILCSFINNTSDGVVRLPSTQPYNGINYHLMDGSEIEIKAGKATEISFLLVSSTDVVVSSKTSL